MPTFDDWERICATVIRWVARGSCSWMIRSATRIEDGSVKRVVGRDDLLRQRRGDGDDLERRAGLVDVGDGAVARASGGRRAELVRVEAGRDRHREHAPVRGSSTTALPPLAPHFLTVSRSTVSAVAWIRWSIVRKTSSPARSGLVAITSITRPLGSRTVVWLPGLPTSACRATARALRGRCCRSRRSRARAPRRRAAGSSAAPRSRSRGPAGSASRAPLPSPGRPCA